MSVKLKLKGEAGTSLGELRLIRLALERQNELFEQIAESLSIKKTISTRIKQNSEEE